MNAKQIIKKWIIRGAALATPLCAFAQTTLPPKVITLMGKLYTTILNPIIVFLFAAAFLYFMYGVLKMVWYGDSEGEREQGRQSIIWGIVGMFVMFSVFTIIRILVNSFGGSVTDALKNV